MRKLPYQEIFLQSNNQLLKLKELNRRVKEYEAKNSFPNLSEETAILVDDGVATGTSAIAGLRFLKKFTPKKLVFAAPVCAPDSIRVLKKEADEIICLDEPIGFGAVGQFYENFEQTSDSEVKELMEKTNKKL